MAHIDDAAEAELDTVWIAGTMSLALNRSGEDGRVADLVRWREADSAGKAALQPCLLFRQVLIGCGVANSSGSLVAAAVATLVMLAPVQVLLCPVAVNFVHEEVESMGFKVGGDRKSSPFEASLLAGHVSVYLIPIVVADHFKVPAPWAQYEDHPSVLFLKADTFPNAGRRDRVSKGSVTKEKKEKGRQHLVGFQRFSYCLEGTFAPE